MKVSSFTVVQKVFILNQENEGTPVAETAGRLGSAKQPAAARKKRCGESNLRATQQRRCSKH